MAVPLASRNLVWRLIRQPSRDIHAAIPPVGSVRGSVRPLSSFPSASRLHLRRYATRPRLRHHPSSGSLSSLSSCDSPPVATSDSGSRERRRLYFPRRAVMYVPACDERKVMKTTTIRADSLVFDLEDGVALNQKEVARDSVGAAIATCRRGDSLSAHSEHVVRVNGVESGLLNLDLSGVFRSCDCHGVSPDAIMLPKADTVEHIAELDLCLSYHLPPSLSPLPLYIITESPAGLQNLRDICHFATRHTTHLKLCAVVFGSDDFLAALGGVRSKGASELVYARQALVGVARASGADAIDMVDNDFRDLESLKAQSEEGARMGFSGKQVIHPSQVAVVQEAFSPSEERVEWATGLITAFERHQESGQGAFVYEGHMIDKPLLLQAQNIVHLHNIINDITT